jgi:hypothetical protein
MTREPAHVRRARLRRTSAMHADPKPLTTTQAAEVRSVWAERTANASIHCYTGQSPETVRDKVGTLIFVVLCACLLSGQYQDLPDVRILRASCSILLELVDSHSISHLQRSGLASAVQAIERLLPTITADHMLIAAQRCQNTLSSGPVTYGQLLALGKP